MRFRWLALLCIFLLLVYGASPYFSFWRFTAALRSGDSAALSARMDFPAIRASLKKQLVARFAQRTTSDKWWGNLGPTLIDAIVDACYSRRHRGADIESGSPEESSTSAAVPFPYWQS